MRTFIATFPVDNITRKEALEYIQIFLKDSKPHFAVAINPEKIMKALRDEKLGKIIRASDLNFVDGIGVVWAFRIFYHERVKERITGIDLFSETLEIAFKAGNSVYFLGSKEETIKKAVKNISEKYPGLKIAGFHNGYFENAESIVEEIRQSGADILFTGMGSPKQEYFISDNLNLLGVKFAMGVGGSFNVFAGEYKRAPHLVQSLGLEWLYRFILDPKRLPRVLSLPKFIFLVGKTPRQLKENVPFMGINISNRNISDNLHIVDNFINSRSFHLVVTLNGEMASKALNDREFLYILKTTDLVIPDGVGIIWGARRFGERILYRIPGIDFAWEILKLAEKEGYRVYFLGACEDVLKEAINRIKKEFPSLNIVGSHSGYFDDEEEKEIVSQIKEGDTQILFVGMGGIKQEKWIWKNKEALPLCMGIGGSFDVWGGKVKRAPMAIRRLGLEWFYRIIIQPSRILRARHLFTFAFRITFKRIEV